MEVANQFSGELAIDRRVRVFWPAEGAFFAGLVTAFNGKSGRHTVRYDDGDMEEVLFAAERMEWVAPGEDESAAVSRAPATAAGPGRMAPGPGPGARHVVQRIRNPRSSLAHTDHLAPPSFLAWAYR